MGFLLEEDHPNPDGTIPPILVNAALHCRWQHTQDQRPAAVKDVSPEQQ